MFGLFKKKETGPAVTNKVWMSTTAKWNACLQLLKENPAIQFVTWFDGTNHELNSFFEKHNHANKVIMYRQVLAAHANDYVFAEHYPLVAKEKELFEKLGTNKIIVLNALDEALFKLFGSEGIITMMQKLGMKEDEMIEHSMVSSSITNAQQKLEKRVLVDNTARSQQEWLDKNVK
jgi:hypothetical protein